MPLVGELVIKIIFTVYYSKFLINFGKSRYKFMYKLVKIGKKVYLFFTAFINFYSFLIHLLIFTDIYYIYLFYGEYIGILQCVGKFNVSKKLFCCKFTIVRLSKAL